MDPASLLAALMSGDVDINVMGRIPLEDWDMAKEQENLQIFSEPGTSYSTLLMNTKKPYQTEAFRQAVSMAINRDVLVQALLKGEGQQVVTPIAPVSPYFNDKIKVWYDVDKAKEMLEKEQFPFDQELKFYTSAGTTTERAAALIAQDLEKIGLKVKIQAVDFTKLMELMREGEHDFGIIGSGGTLDPSESREMLAKGSSVNFAQLEDSTLTDLIDKGNEALTFEDRKPIFDEFQEKIMEISPMAYLYTSNNLVAASKRLSNLPVKDFDCLNWSLWTWKVAD